MNFIVYNVYFFNHFLDFICSFKTKNILFTADKISSEGKMCNILEHQQQIFRKCARSSVTIDHRVETRWTLANTATQRHASDGIIASKLCGQFQDNSLQFMRNYINTNTIHPKTILEQP